MHCFVFVRCQSSGSQNACRCSQKADSCSKRPRGRPKGLEHALLTTELAAKTCHDTGSVKQRLLEKHSFKCSFLILPHEFIDNQINNLAITKNCQKRPRAARDSIHSWGGVETCVLGLALTPNIEYSFGFNIQRDEQNLQKQKARKRARTKLFWGKFLPHFEDEQWTADCWRWSAHTVDSLEMKGSGPPNQQPLFEMLQNHANRYSKRSKSIALSNDRLCDP